MLEAARHQVELPAASSPGLVGGHCIGVDPYYLSHCAQSLGHQPRVILAGRAINDGMGAWIADPIHDRRGEPDRHACWSSASPSRRTCPTCATRKVVDLVAAARPGSATRCTVHDPLADPAAAAHEYGLTLDRRRARAALRRGRRRRPAPRLSGDGRGRGRGAGGDGGLIADLNGIWRGRGFPGDSSTAGRSRPPEPDADDASLVTGAAGFIGYHVARALLERGERVVGIDNLNAYYDPQLKQDRLAELRGSSGELPLPQVDFADHEALDAALGRSEFDRIVHLGAQAGVRYSIENPRAYVVGEPRRPSQPARARARSARSSHLVYASSSSVYGGNTSLPFRGRGPRRPPALALRRDQEGRRADERDLCPSLPAAADRACASSPSTAPGGGPTWRCGSSPGRSSPGEPIQVFNHGEMRRDFTYIDDIVAGRRRLPRQSAAGRRRRQGRRQRRPAPALQYRQQPLRGADADDRAARAGLRPQGRAASCCRCSPATSPRPSPTSARSQRDLGFAPTHHDRRRHSALRRAGIGGYCASA